MPHPRKPAPADFPIADLLAQRWSPRAIAPDALSDEQIHILFEAARWAPSNGNGQPWRYVYAVKDAGEERLRLESLLTEGNYWAKNAYLLIIAFAQMKRVNSSGDLVDSPYGMHDTGAASLSLALQAASMGLAAHQMAGFDRDAANELLGVPSDFIPASMIAVGQPGSDSHLNEKHREAETAPRVRKPQNEFVFRGGWKG